MEEGWLGGSTKVNNSTIERMLSFVELKLKMFMADVPWNDFQKYIKKDFVYLLENSNLHRSNNNDELSLPDFLEENGRAPAETLEGQYAEHFLFHLYYVKKELLKYKEGVSNQVPLAFLLESLFYAAENQSALREIILLNRLLSSFDAETKDNWANALTCRLRDAIYAQRMKEGSKKPRENALDKSLEKVLDELIARNSKMPTAREVWIELAPDKCIQEVDEDTIFWKSPKGKENTTQFHSFENRLTKLKKKLRN